MEVAIKHKSKTTVSFVLGTTIGTATCLLLWIGASAIIATLVLNETLQIQFIAWLTQLINGIIAFLGTFISGKIVYEKKYLASITCGAAYLCVMICCALLFTDGLSWKVWLGMASIITGSIAAILINMRKRGVYRSKRNRKIFR